MHHYPQHIGDYRKHTAHLTMVEDGAYRRMLDTYYMHERPLPADVSAVQRLASARTREERAAVEAVLREFFTLGDDGWHNSRADEEIAAYQSRANAARENGKLGGRPKTKQQTENKPDGYSTEPKKKLTENRKPETDNQEEEEVEGERSPEAVAVEIWNEAASRVGWPKVQRLTEPRRKAVKARLADVGGLQGWQNAIAKAETSSFLIGRSGRTGEHANWQCGLDFILRESTFTKLMEGGFDDRSSSPNGVQSGHERQRQALAEWSREGDR